jgi:hypothetical protein
VRFLTQVRSRGAFLSNARAPSNRAAGDEKRGASPGLAAPQGRPAALRGEGHLERCGIIEIEGVGDRVEDCRERADASGLAGALGPERHVGVGGEGIHLESLPSSSPELQSAERLWPLTNEAVANGLFEEIEELEETLAERCVELLDQTEAIRDLTNYHWWPEAS